jgi:pimeloyl-ACP methyl ester carboxylesterase
VLPGVATFTRVCAYDRPGTVIGLAVKDRSRSDPVAMPRSAIGAVQDLHALLRAARIPVPVVLAGHSTGGLLVLLYAYTFPHEVAGLVLVDALPDGLRRDLTPSQFDAFLKLNTERPKELESYTAYETIPFDPAFAALQLMERIRPLRPMPLVVVSRGLPLALPSSVPAGFSQALERAWRIGQANLVNLEPDAQHVIAMHADHYIMLEQPDLIVRAIRDVVDAIRRRARLRR